MAALWFWVLAPHLCLGQMATDIEWDVVYTPTKLPQECGWGRDIGPSNTAELTADGTLHIIDTSSANGERACYTRGWGARPDRGAIVQATVKVVECTARAGVCLTTADGVHEETLTLYPDRISLAHSGLEHAMDTTDGFHTYTVRVAGLGIEVWVDGELAIDGWGKFTHDAYNARQTLIFGSLSSQAQSESHWKTVRYVSWRVPVERIAGAQDVVIYRKEGIYACFPSLRRLPDGRLYTSFGTRVRRSHIDGTGGGARMVSSDEGRTWEPADAVPQPDMYTREDGTIIIPRGQAWIHVDEAELPKIRERNRRWMAVRPGTIAYLGDALVDITAPGEEKRTLNLGTPVPGGCHAFHDACSFIRKGNLWLKAIYCFTGTNGLSGVWVIRSEDDGESWELVHVGGPLGDRIGLGETALCDNGRGEIIALMRSGAGGKYNTHQSFSTDGGKTWSPPQDTGIWGYPCHVLLLRDGRLLCSYGYRRDAMGVRAVLSEDGGHTWDLHSEIIIRADGTGNGGDNGYPISLQMKDGHIFTIYYINDFENVTHVAGTHWDLPPVSDK